VRIALALEYCGARFRGWQRQRGERTVQACLEDALSSVAGRSIRVQCAGRTDTGVHASYQVAHFDGEGCAGRPLRAWTLGSNTLLPADIAVLWARPAPAEFHARYAARRRCYRYLILNRPARPGLRAAMAAWEPRELAVTAMGEAAAHLVGEYDFTSYRGGGCQAKNPRRRIYRLQVWKRGDLVILEVEANAFLQRMVRNIAGVLIMVGLGRRRPAWAREVLYARDRSRGGFTASPAGLYLADVRYPAEYRLPRPLCYPGGAPP